MKAPTVQWTMILVFWHLAMTSAQDFQQTSKPCFTKAPFDDVKLKPKYKIGVLAIRGTEAAFSTYNATFTEYLSATAGHRFDPLIEFEMVAVDFESVYELSKKAELDFLFVNPSLTSCIASQFSTQSLASLIVSTTVYGEEISLSEFAGLTITQAGNDEINTITDLKNKTVAAISISGFGSGLMQFYEMQKNGLSYISDPAQLFFTGDQGDVVRGVVDGTFDAGFIRTGMIEKTKDRDGKLVDPSKIKIIDKRRDLTASGVVFPYEHSTPLYPEWNFVATKTTPFEISREVQAALLAVERQGKTGKLLEACLGNGAVECTDLAALDPESSCDTTLETASAALKALSNGGYVGWRTTLAYNDVQEVLYDTGNLKKDPMSKEWGCVSGANLYETINCPNGFYRLPRDLFQTSCELAGFNCPEGSECVCRPCFKALPVEVAPQETFVPGAGCKKMGICGALAQNEVLNFTIADNLGHEDGLNLLVKVLEGTSERQIDVIPGPNPNHYTLSLSSTRVGLLVLEIFDGEEQIDASPLRVQVVYRTCPIRQTASDDGTCRCADTTFAIFGHCIERQLISISIMIPIMVIFVILVFCYLKRKRREADSLWQVKRSELQFCDPPKVIGEGSFGFILLAEYRGSKVAVKKVLPCKTSASGGKLTTLGTLFGSDSSGAIPEDTGKTVEDPVDLEKGRRSPEPETARSFSSSSSDSTSPELEALPKPGMNSNVAFSNNGEVVGSGSTQTKRSLLRTRKANVVCWVESRSTQLKREFIREMRLLSQLRHPNNTTVMGAVIVTGVEPMMIMEFMEHGSLQQVLLNPSIIMEAEMIHGILKDIAQGIRFLHSSNPPIIHGDLKSDNVLIDSKFRAKLSDFGLSCRQGKEATGTPLWMAPELLTDKAVNSQEADMYSFGIMMNEVFSRKEPYIEAADESSKELIAQITDGSQNRRPVIPSHCPIKIKKLLQFLWHPAPKLRPTASELDNRLKEMDVTLFQPIAQASKSHRLHENKQEGNSESFLYQAFPKHVAEVLAAGGKVEPETHEVVTIFFSDIVGFTAIASKFEPLKVSQMLHRLYLKFDDLARKHELFKIETIGDAYMCAGNLATDQHNDHVKRVALFAKDAIKAASTTFIDEDDPSAGCIQIRVGFHSGPVVSNVVGNLNPRYGVFGDTVNVASRMESSSEVGKIHCSRTSAMLLMDQSPETDVKFRGATDVKGKGMMTTYWVPT